MSHDSGDNNTWTIVVQLWGLCRIVYNFNWLVGPSTSNDVG